MHYFAGKGPYSQSYGFSIDMYRCESCVIKKPDAFELWCWRRLLRVPWTARRLNQSILRENQPWIFTGRTDAEAEASILWPPDTKSWLFWKDPDAGKDWRQEEKSTVEDEIVSIINSVDMNLSKLWETVKDRDAWHAAVHGVSKSWTWQPREQSVSFRIPGFCLVLFRLLCLKISCLFIAKTLLCFSPKPLLPMFITGCPVWAKDRLLCLAWMTTSCRVLCRVRENILLSNPGHILFPDMRPRALVVSEPFCEALASPLPQSAPVLTISNLKGVNSSSKGWTRSGHDTISTTSPSFLRIPAPNPNLSFLSL